MEIDRDISPGDEADRADYYRESVIDYHVKEAMRKAAEIPKGTAGECDLCGSYSVRLIDNACCKCIDKYTEAEARNGKMFR